MCCEIQLLSASPECMYLEKKKKSVIDKRKGVVWD